MSEKEIYKKVGQFSIVKSGENSTSIDKCFQGEDTTCHMPLLRHHRMLPLCRIERQKKTPVSAV